MQTFIDRFPTCMRTGMSIICDSEDLLPHVPHPPASHKEYEDWTVLNRFIWVNIVRSKDYASLNVYLQNSSYGDSLFKPMFEAALENNDVVAVDMILGSRLKSSAVYTKPRLDRLLSDRNFVMIQRCMELWKCDPDLFHDWNHALSIFVQEDQEELIEMLCAQGPNLISKPRPLAEAVHLDKPRYFDMLKRKLSAQFHFIPVDIVIRVLLRCKAQPWRVQFAWIRKFNKGFSHECYNMFVMCGFEKFTALIDKTTPMMPSDDALVSLCEESRMTFLRYFVEVRKIKLPRKCLFATLYSQSVDMFLYVEKHLRFPVATDDPRLFEEACQGGCFQIIMTMYQRANKPTMTPDQKSYIIHADLEDVVKVIVGLGEPFFDKDTINLCIIQARTNMLKILHDYGPSDGIGERSDYEFTITFSTHAQSVKKKIRTWIDRIFSRQVEV